MTGHKCPRIATAVRAVVFALEEAWRMFLGVFDTADHDSDAVMDASRQEQGVLRVRVRASKVLNGGVGRRSKTANGRFDCHGGWPDRARRNIGQKGN